jgi:hypothetical protein
MDLIDQFHSNPDIFIFLISIMAGGTGLNLTGMFSAAALPVASHIHNRGEQSRYIWSVA